MKKAVIFDLDGTLLDTIGDLADACNYALRKRSLPLHTEQEYKTFVGWGIRKLVELAVPASVAVHKASVDEILKDVADYYAAHWNVKTRPYPGIVDMLDSLSEQGIKMAVLSNKPQDFTELTVKYFFHKDYFFAIEGAKGNILKPMPEALKPVFDKLGDKEEYRIFFVGDSKTDMETAKAGDIIPVGVSWGFRNEDELRENGAVFIAHSPAELEKFLSEA
jgi:phosphoglycolate phosphatase